MEKIKKIGLPIGYAIFNSKFNNEDEGNAGDEEPVWDCQVTSIWYDAKKAMTNGSEYPPISVNNLTLGVSLEDIEECFGTYEIQYESDTLTMLSCKYFDGDEALYLTFNYNDELGVTAIVCNTFGY